MQKCSLITVLSLSVLMLAGCTTTYTMTTRTGEIIETQGKPEVDTAMKRRVSRRLTPQPDFENMNNVSSYNVHQKENILIKRYLNEIKG
ncbi:YgdI/YgdR family lipoprotein [Salmonella enterica subsp. enterica serovar Minnesota]